MPAVGDFRNYALDSSKIDASGKDVGRKVYWKLYAIENLVRIVVHSVLTAQVAPNWWTVAVDPGIRAQVRGRMTEYAKQPWHSTPGKHDIYYTFLSDLNKIITAHSHLFRPVIPDIDQWIARIEQVRLPRNIVGHMNWPSATDRQRIDVFYADIQHLVHHLANAGLALSIP
jgi:hypothetical protein